MCEHSTGCSNGATCQLVLRNDRTGLETCEYYCNAHLVVRVWDVEADETLAPVRATAL